jgi:hypothetical protein
MLFSRIYYFYYVYEWSDREAPRPLATSHNLPEKQELYAVIIKMVAPESKVILRVCKFYFHELGPTHPNVEDDDLFYEV